MASSWCLTRSVCILVMTSQLQRWRWWHNWRGNYGALTWKVIFNSLYISLIHGEIRVRNFGICDSGKGLDRHFQKKMMNMKYLMYFHAFLSINCYTLMIYTYILVCYEYACMFICVLIFASRVFADKECVYIDIFRVHANVFACAYAFLS